MRIIYNINSLGCEQPSGLDVNQSPNACIYSRSVRYKNIALCTLCSVEG